MSVLVVAGVVLAVMAIGIKILYEARVDSQNPDRRGSGEGTPSRRIVLVAAPATVISALVLGIWVTAWVAAHFAREWRDVMIAGFTGLIVCLLSLAFPISGRLYRWATGSSRPSKNKPIMLPVSYWLTECSAGTAVCALIGVVAQIRQTGVDLVVLLPVAVALPPLYRALIGPLFLRKQLRAVIAELRLSPSDELGQLQQWVNQLAVRYRLRTAPALIQIPGRQAFAAEALRPEAAIFLSEELLNAMTSEERKGLVAHEFAHIVRRERLRRSLTLALVTLWYLGLYGWWVTQHPGTTFGARVAWLIVYSYIMQAVRTSLSRRSEFAADRLATEMVGDRGPVVGALHKIARVWRLPMDRATRTHPSPAARIAALGDTP